MRAFTGLFASTAIVIAGWAAPTPASACGGCFHPPPPPMGSPTPVTGHRMVVAISPRGTTLWDQIEYAGSPEDFVWVLPVDPSARVELAEEAFFVALEDATRITMVAPEPPRTVCPDPCDAIDFGGFGDEAAPMPFLGGDGGTPVDVHYEGVVGPYETVTIGSDDPEALVAWLSDRGYQVPASILPTIRHYTERGSAFSVLRLQPNAGIQQMRPVRVTSPGLSTLFPLRMVAAGVQGSVTLELFVFAEGRMEAENFGNAEVDRDAITYDWATDTFDYDELFEVARFAGMGPGANWVTEYAGPAPSSLAAFQLVDDMGTRTNSAGDWAVVSAALDRPYLTRMRTELPVAELGVDLNLWASSAGDLSETRIDVVRELDRAPDLECPTFCSGGTGERDFRGVGRCEVDAGPGPAGLMMVILGGLFGAFVLRRRR